jgi:hypothetical protein
MLAPGGTLFVTVPAGYNPALDAAIRDGALGFTRVTAMRRTSRTNRWAEATVEEALAAEYDRLLYTAHGVLFCERRAATSRA